ncbi:ATP-binding protein [Streptomyces kasugaensis]|uniref:ATP-binding protein n=1 Tax=Streptomyces TaxID=1883 RepID=UPI003CC82754
MNHEISGQRLLPRPAAATHAAEPARQFRVQLSATRRGARLARLLTTEQLRSWGLPFETPAQIVAELAANAISHGRVPGRDFRLTVTVKRSVDAEIDTIRIEVIDARSERLPVPEAQQPTAEQESGRGLLLVAAFADRWGTVSGPPPCKTVWAECDLSTRA